MTVELRMDPLLVVDIVDVGQEKQGLDDPAKIPQRLRRQPICRAWGPGATERVRERPGRGGGTLPGARGSGGHRAKGFGVPSRVDSFPRGRTKRMTWRGNTSSSNLLFHLAETGNARASR